MMSEQLSSTLDSDYQLAPILAGYGSTLAFGSEPTSRGLISHSPYHPGTATHVAQFFGKAGGMFPDTSIDYSTRPARQQNWFTAKLPEKTRNLRRGHPAYIGVIGMSRSDEEFKGFNVTEGTNRSLWSFLQSRTYHVTDDLAEPISLHAQFMAEFAAKKKNALRISQAYQIRIEELRSYAEVDGLTISESSENDFWLFIMSMPFAGEAELVLLDNGNLRAIWDDENGNHFGLQFLGGRELQYVIFRHRKGRRTISRVAGRDTFDSVKRQIRTFELETLLQI